MSPILAIQRRHHVTARIRIGEKGKKGEPRRLTDCMRITSPNKAVVEAWAETYGGDVEPWAQQWEVRIPRTELPIMLLPGQSCQQWYERWRGAVCERRCDGERQTTDEPCVCLLDDAGVPLGDGACVVTTRLTVLAHEVPVLGATMLVTHGVIAAQQLPASVALADGALARGVLVPGTLRISEHKAAGRRYVVPSVELVGVSFAQLQSGQVEQPAIGQAPTPSIDRPTVPAFAAPSQPPDEGSGESVAPPAPPTSNQHAAMVMRMLDDLTPEQKAAVRPAWKDRGIRFTTDPEFGPSDVEAASELLMPYLEVAEKGTT